MQPKPNNRLAPDFSPPRDVSNSQKKKMFPDRNLHQISHNAVLRNEEYVPNGISEVARGDYTDSRNQNGFQQYNSAPGYS